MIRRYPYHGLVALFFLAACGARPALAPPEVAAPSHEVPPIPPPPITPDNPFRAEPPAPRGSVSFVAPQVVERGLRNGLRVLFVERHELPIVSVRLVVTAGAGDVRARPGAVSFMGAMLEQGTRTRSALELSDAYEALGAQHSAGFEWDSGGVSVKALTSKLDEALTLLSDVALAPAFSDAEIERLRSRRIAAIQSERSNPNSAAQNAIAASVFGRNHPYGHSLSGEEADARGLTRTDVVRAYENALTIENAAIVVAGDVTAETLLPQLERAFGSWGKHGQRISHAGPTEPASKATDSHIVLVDKPGAQSQVGMVRVGAPFASRDRDALVILNAITGGMFSSRINMNLREKHAYTYGARSYVAMRHGAGPLGVGAAIFADKTVAAVKEIVAELEGLRRDGPTDDEMALAKENIRLAMPGKFESVSDVTGALAELATYDLPLDEYAKRPGRIDAVRRDDVSRLAKRWLDPKAMTLVLVGDKAKLANELTSLGLGPIEERDPYGNRVR